MYRLRPCSVLSLVLLLVPAYQGRAAQISMDLDGPSGLFGFQQLSPNGLINFSEGNGVIAGAGPILLGNLPPLGTTFQGFLQAKLSSVQFDNGDEWSLPNFPFAPFFLSQEITMQMAIPLEFTGFDGLGRLNLEIGNVGANFLNFYFDDPADASIPTGLGFNDGTSILSASFVSLDFAVSPTLASASVFEAIANVTFTNPAFFDVPIQLQILLQLDLDGLVKIPPQLPPSAEIVGYTPVLGDLLLSMDLTARFATIPEASSLLFAGLGCGAIVAGWARRRASRMSK